MKNIRFLWISCLLLLRATCNAEDPKRASSGVDPRQNKAINERTLHVRPLIAIRLTKSAPSNLRNQNPPIIGGPAYKPTSAINGTGMKHKP
jgi:hypothetical protein